MSRRFFEKKELNLIRQGSELKGRTVASELNARVAESGTGLKELLEDRAFRELANIFETYYRVQLSEAFLQAEPPVLIELSDEMSDAAVRTLVSTGRLSEAGEFLNLWEKGAHLTPEMQALSGDLEAFRKAETHYEHREMEEAERISTELLEKYPQNPTFLKFQCRFRMARAVEHRKEAERFVGECVKLFPEDGCFLKYQADLLWMNGSGQKALLLYAEAKGKTDDAEVLDEMNRLFYRCKPEVLETCERLLEYKAKEDAVQLMELWAYLMPQDEDVRGCYFLAKVAAARTQSELEGIINEILGKIEVPMLNSPTPEKTEKTAKTENTENQETEVAPEEKTAAPGELYYKKALTRAWRRLGYPAELAALYTEVKCASEESELEWLAEEIRSHQIKKEMRAEVYKLVGDVRLKQGQTIFAFENYQKALAYAKPSYVKTELVRIILSDLSQGSRRAAVYAKTSNAMPFLDGWLGKYGTMEELTRTIRQLV